MVESHIVERITDCGDSFFSGDKQQVARKKFINELNRCASLREVMQLLCKEHYIALLPLCIAQFSVDKRTIKTFHQDPYLIHDLPSLLNDAALHVWFISNKSAHHDFIFHLMLFCAQLSYTNQGTKSFCRDAYELLHDIKVFKQRNRINIKPKHVLSLLPLPQSLKLLDLSFPTAFSHWHESELETLLNSAMVKKTSYPTLIKWVVQHQDLSPLLSKKMLAQICHHTPKLYQKYIVPKPKLVEQLSQFIIDNLNQTERQVSAIKYFIAFFAHTPSEYLDILIKFNRMASHLKDCLLLVFQQADRQNRDKLMKHQYASILINQANAPAIAKTLTDDKNILTFFALLKKNLILNEDESFIRFIKVLSGHQLCLLLESELAETVLTTANIAQTFFKTIQLKANATDFFMRLSFEQSKRLLARPQALLLLKEPNAMQAFFAKPFCFEELFAIAKCLPSDKMKQYYLARMIEHNKLLILDDLEMVILDADTFWLEALIQTASVSFLVNYLNFIIASEQLTAEHIDILYQSREIRQALAQHHPYFHLAYLIRHQDNLSPSELAQYHIKDALKGLLNELHQDDIATFLHQNPAYQTVIMNDIALSLTFKQTLKDRWASVFPRQTQHQAIQSFLKKHQAVFGKKIPQQAQTILNAEGVALAQAIETLCKEHDVLLVDSYACLGIKQVTKYLIYRAIIELSALDKVANPLSKEELSLLRA